MGALSFARLGFGRRTLAQAAGDEYLPTVMHLASFVSRRSEVRAWIAALGDRPVERVGKTDVLAVRAGWVRGGVAPKTANNRVATRCTLRPRIRGRISSRPRWQS